MIPPSKALEVFINRISSEIINVDAVLVTGYPRNMRDVVEYMARVSPGIKFSKKKKNRHSSCNLKCFNTFLINDK
jgi:hypothetical protein